VIESCECEFVQYLKVGKSIVYPNDEEPKDDTVEPFLVYTELGSDPAEAVCVSCLHAISNCNVCEQTTSWDGSDILTEVMCTQCRQGFWIDENGKCVENSCRELNLNNECIACNEKGDGFDWKT